MLSACDSSGEGIDPGIVEVPLAFIKRPIPVDDMGDEVQADLRDPLLFSAGGDVYLRSNSTVNADVINLTRSVTGGVGAPTKKPDASVLRPHPADSLLLSDPYFTATTIESGPTRCTTFASLNPASLTQPSPSAAV